MKRRHPHKENILLVNITRLGDMLQATPTICGMKRENPNAKITVLVEKQFSEVCHYLPDIDEVVALDLGMTVRSLDRQGDGIVDAYEYLSEVVDSLRSKNFDYCLNMSSSGYTALLLKLIDVKRRGGWAADSEGYRVIESDWARLFATSVFHQNRQFNSLNLVDIFRCSADVEEHPYKLQIKILPEAKEYAESLIREHEFTNEGPLIALQAGASQGKRQWDPRNFIKLVNVLTGKYKARVVLTGSKGELNIINPILEGTDKRNVMLAAGKTSIPQLAALLHISDLLVTGDTGPMHISVAAGTPVVSLFLASAFGFETGPYSEGNLILQPVISCGPCNPNKSCSRPDCHFHIDPEALAELVWLRVNEDIKELPDNLFDTSKVTVYRSHFDDYGFCDLSPIHRVTTDFYEPFRRAYRYLWLEDIGGFKVPESSKLKVSKDLEPLAEVAKVAEEGVNASKRLIYLIENPNAPASELGVVSDKLSQVDELIEKIGYEHPFLGPLTRMYVFAKENIQGKDPRDLTEQTLSNYYDLQRRARRFAELI